MEGMDDDLSQTHPVATHPKGETTYSVIFSPPRYEQVKEHNFQANVMK
jgi:hypothetical protein